MPGGLPKDGVYQVGFDEGVTLSGHTAWGWFDTTRKLTDEEVEHYELEFAYAHEAPALHFI